MAEPPSDNVVHFPPCPPVPTPPDYPADPRQRSATKLIGAIAAAVETSGHGVAGANLSHGFPAASVDLGRLQETIERGLAGFTREIIAARWEVDVRRWIHSLLFSWIQRLKEATVMLRENGIAISLQTQDDRGYYDYTFDVFPWSRRAKADGAP